MKEAQYFFPSKIHLKHCVLYEFNQGNSASGATRNICKTYKMELLKERTCRNWFKKFREGDFGLENKSKIGRPKKIKNEVLEEYVEDNPFSTIKKISLDLDHPQTTIYDSLKRLDYSKKEGPSVPHDLDEKGKKIRLETCKFLLNKMKEGSFLKNYNW